MSKVFSWWAIVGALIVIAALPLMASAQNTSALIGEALDKQLSKPEITFNGTLPQIIQSFNDMTSVPIQADSTVYDALPWGEMTTFNAKLEHQTLRQALSAICQKLGLEFEIGKEAVELRPLPALRRMGRRSTVDELKALDLLSSTPLGSDDLHPTAEKLLGLIDARLEKSPFAIENRAFDADTSKTVINVAKNSTLLDALEEITNQTNATWYPWGKSIVVVKKQDQVRMQLSRRMTTRFNGVDVNQVLLELSERSGVNFQIEPGAIGKIGAEFRTINLVLDNASVQQTLEHVAGFTGLGYAVTDKGVWIWNASPTTEPSR